MSKLHDLIAQLCPDGVPYKKLNEVLNYEQPSKYLVSSKDYSDEYSTPVLTAGKTFILGYTDEVNGIYQASNDNPVIIFDDFTTDFKWVNFPFKAKSSGMKMLTPIDSNTCCFRYIYYAMSVIDFVPSDHKRHWISQYSNFTIPLPPLPVQSEIVRILDAFTELEAELEAELAGRIEQYEYYRDRLLDKKNLAAMDGKPVETKKLGDIVDILDSKRKPVKRGSRVSGKYPYYGANGVQDYINDYLFDGEFLLVGEDGSVITDKGTPILNWANGKIWVNNHAHVLQEKADGRYILRYIKYALECKNIAKLIHGAIPKLNQQTLKSIEIPVPSLSTQKRVVDILDRFDTLTTSLTDGIPAEIAMRREQYEYYRSRLLDFPRLPEDSNSDSNGE